MSENRQWPQYLAVFSATFLTVGNGIQMAWPSPTVPKLLSKDLGFGISEEEASYIVLLSPLGYIIGSPLAGLLLDRIGRKNTLLILAPIQVITWFSIATSENVATLYFARLLMGISDSGMYTALPAYIGEIVEPKIRGKVGTYSSLGILIGVLLINIYGSYVPVRIAAYISLFSPIAFFATFAWMPESPYYFVAKGLDYKARESLKSLRRVDNVEAELSNIKKGVQRQLEEPGRFLDIFLIKSNLKGFGILAILRTIQQFAGIHAAGFYMQVIFKNANFPLSAHVSAIICNGFTLVFTFVGSFLIDKFGRRIMILASCFGAATSLFVLGTYFYLLGTGYRMDPFKWAVFIDFILFYIFCSLGLLVIPTVMMGELLSSNIKAKSLTLMNVYLGLCMSASSKLLQWTGTNLGAHVPFYIFAANCVFGIVFTYACVPETKGKSLEEIQQTLKGYKTEKESNTLL